MKEMRSMPAYVKIVFGNRPFPLLTGGYLHVAVHEMGHSLASKAFGDLGVKARIYVKDGILFGGMSIHSHPPKGWLADTTSLAMGPIAGCALSGIQMIALASLKDRISTPVAIALSTGPLIWLFGECLYATTSMIQKDSGDWGRLRKLGPISLISGSVGLVSVCALGLFGALKMWKR